MVGDYMYISMTRDMLTSLSLPSGRGRTMIIPPRKWLAFTLPNTIVMRTSKGTSAKPLSVHIIHSQTLLKHTIKWRLVISRQKSRLN